MKVNSVSRSAIYTAGAAFFMLSLLLTSCVNSSPLITGRDNNNYGQSVSFKIQPQFERQSVRLLIQKPVGKIVWVKFFDIDGAIFESFCARKRETVIDRTYNFENAAEGVYRFEIYDGDKTTIKKVTLHREQVKTVSRLEIE